VDVEQLKIQLATCSSIKTCWSQLITIIATTAHSVKHLHPLAQAGTPVVSVVSNTSNSNNRSQIY